MHTVSNLNLIKFEALFSAVAGATHTIPSGISNLYIPVVVLVVVVDPGTCLARLLLFEYVH